MRTFMLTLAILAGALTLSSRPTPSSPWFSPTSVIGATTLSAHAVTIQDPQPPQNPPQINVEVKREGGGRWYMNPTWMAIGGIALVLLVLIVALAARGSGSGGTTVVRG
jgi:hypothetical protein